MTALTVIPRNKKELSAVKYFFKALGVEYTENKEDNIITNPELIRRIELAKTDRSQKIQVDPNDIWKSIL